MSCQITKDENSFIGDKIHDRIMRKINHEQPAPGDEVTYLICDGQFHWAYYGWGPDVRRDRWLTEALREKCPGYVQQEMEAFIGREGDMEKTFANFIVADENRDAYTKVKGWKKTDFKTLILFGATGRGKTHLAKAVQMEYLKDYKNTAIITAEALYETFIKAQPAANEYDIEAQQQLAEIRAAELFILDDLGTERKTSGGFFDEQFKKLLDETKGRLIVTTNLTENDIANRYNEKIVSRIMEKSIAVHLRGTDHRRAK